MKTQDHLHGLLSIIGGIVLFMLIGGPSFVKAQEVPNIASRTLRVDISKLDALWFEAMNLLDNRKYSSVKLKLKEVELKKVELGFNNLPSHSEVLIKQAEALKDQNQIGDALMLLEAAKQLSPDLANVYFALAATRFARNKIDVYGVGQEIFRGVVRKLKDINTIAAYTNNVLGVLIVTCLFIGGVFIVFTFIYYQRAIIFYYFKHLLPLPFPLFIASVIGWVIVGVVTLFLGVYWGILLLAVTLIPHVESSAKRILVGFFVFGSLLAALLTVVSITFIVFDGEYIQSLRDISYGYFSTRTAKTLQQRLKEEPTDAYALFGLAYIASHTGHQQDAIETYGNIPGSYSDRAAVQNNLGNLYHHKYQETKNEEAYGKAEDAYTNAIRYASRMFEPRYNSGQHLLVKYAPEDAQDQLTAARRYDFERFSRHSGYLEYGIVTVDATISTLALLRKLIDAEILEEGLTLAKRLWRSGSRFENPWYFSGACFIFFMAALLAGSKKGVPKKVVYCQMCGDVFPVKLRRKKEGGAPSKLCTQCTYIFKKKTTVKPEKRTKKVSQIQTHQNLRGLIAKIGSICCPGGGQIYFGYIGKGLLLSLGFYLGSTVLLLKLYTKGLLPLEGNPGPSLITLSISLALFVGIYLFNLFDIFRLSPKNQ